MEHGLGFFIDLQSLITALTSFVTIGDSRRGSIREMKKTQQSS